MCDMKAYILYKDSEHNTLVLRVYNDGCYKDILVKPTRLDNIFVTVGDNIEHSEIYTIFELVDISINC